MSLAANLACIRQQIAEACRHARRPEAEVALMAVTKTHSAETVMEAYAAGLRLFGENRVQEWQEKSLALAHLPARRVPPHRAAAVQQDRPRRGTLPCHRRGRLAEDRDAARCRRARAGQAAAHPDRGQAQPRGVQARRRARRASHAARGPRAAGRSYPCRPDDRAPVGRRSRAIARPYFRELRRLRDTSLAACPSLTQLSMGMSNDFAVAIEEGSTCIRIGTALFGIRQYATGTLRSE